MDTSEKGRGSSATGGEPSRWERSVLEQLALAAVREQRRARRWNVVFRFALLAYLVALPMLYFPRDWLAFESDGRHTALVQVNGVIAAGEDASADRIVSGLEAAYSDPDTAGIILRVNSPGGSPVQAGYVSDEIRRLRAAHPRIPVFAVIADVAASGGYYVAVSADRIYADKASLVGSIGVLMNGFGFVDGMEKLGVERRLITAGDDKGFLDPFSPLKAAHVKHARELLEELHAQFVDVVRTGRGKRLSDDPSLFSGLVWSGQRSVSLGLVDGLGSASYVARDLIGVPTIRDFTPGKSLLESLGARLGISGPGGWGSSMMLWNGPTR